jgi:hypothetical protein
MSPPNKRTEESKAYWRELWLAAKANLGNATAVTTLLGYTRCSPDGQNYGAQAFANSVKKGAIPSKYEAQVLLHQLAGPDGREIALILAQGKGLKFRGLT